MPEMDRARRAHLVGIGGSGMRALARVLLDKGWRLSGSDPAVGGDDPLARAGIRCFSGHAAQQVTPDVECAIHSSAVPADNPELLRAGELAIPVLSYAEMLGLLMQGHRGLAVAGTHGKSTTTAMAAEILVAAGCDPTVICGAAPRNGGDGGRAGNGNTVLVEACEFRRNFLYLRPHDAVILNIEPDHFDCYDSREALESAFARFAALLPGDGRLIVHYGDAAAQRVAASAGCRIETFGEAASPLGDALRGVPNERNSQPPRNATEGVSYRRDTGPRIAGAKEVVNNFPASNVSGTLRVPMTRGTRSVPHTICFEPSPNLTPDWLAANIQGQQGQYGFDLVHGGRRLGRIELSVVGRHNVLNALAATALAASCGVSAEAIIRGLSRFSGLRRRLEPLGTVAGIVFWDDYAHHPTEISTTLQTIREVVPGARVCCLFQPHQALRTARLLDELAFSLQNAERVLIADIFRAREGPPQPGEITAADLAARTRALGQDVPALHAPVDIQHFLQTQLTPDAGAMYPWSLVVIGAGDIGRIGHGLMDWFRECRAAG
jgi:UDP-N-acetylmuramate--alanine ligase